MEQADQYRCDPTLGIAVEPVGPCTVRVCLRGVLSVATADGLRAVLTGVLRIAGIGTVVLDLRELRPPAPDGTEVLAVAAALCLVSGIRLRVVGAAVGTEPGLGAVPRTGPVPPDRTGPVPPPRRRTRDRSGAGSRAAHRAGRCHRQPRG